MLCFFFLFQAAQKADLVIIVGGGSMETVGESKSRSSLDLPGRQNDLIRRIGVG
jgi:beta-glucosidase